MQWRRYLWGIGACPPSSFGNSVHSAAGASLPVKISKITKEKHVLNFHISRQKHAETHVNRLKQSWKQNKSRTEEERKNLCCAPRPHFLATPLAKDKFFKQLSGALQKIVQLHVPNFPDNNYVFCFQSFPVCYLVGF